MSIEKHATYKTFGDFKYHLNFPDEWILNERPHTGRQCYNCVGNGDNIGYAMWRGIILGYCANCAETYDGKRGKGFLELGVEVSKLKYPSAFKLYLGTVDFENYGDIADNEEDTLENHNQLYYQLCDQLDDDKCFNIDCGNVAAPMSVYCNKCERK
jgi:hypothetical protein